MTSGRSTTGSSSQYCHCNGKEQLLFHYTTIFFVVNYKLYYTIVLQNISYYFLQVRMFHISIRKDRPFFLIISHFFDKKFL